MYSNQCQGSMNLVDKKKQKQQQQFNDAKNIHRRKFKPTTKRTIYTSLRVYVQNFTGTVYPRQSQVDKN